MVFLAHSVSRLLQPGVVLAALVVGTCLYAKSTWMIPILATGFVLLPLTLNRLVAEAAPLRTLISASPACITGLIVLTFDSPQPVKSIVLGLCFGGLLLSVARRAINASAHVAVLAYALAVTGFIASHSLVLVLLPLMIWSRTYLGEHTAVQGVVGGGIGFSAFALSSFLLGAF